MSRAGGLERRDPIGDEPGAFLGVENEHARLCHAGVVIGRGDVDLALRCEEAMSLCSAPRGHAAELQRNHLIAEKGDDPPHRADEAGLTSAPALGLGPAQAADERCQQLWQDLGGGSADLFDRCPSVLASGLASANEGGHVDLL
ncbi:MAG: hypothetical protein M1565_08060 [Actinobacteria bacterium]|nr:hypothetical protein [Actinomycetota bacterium]